MMKNTLTLTQDDNDLVVLLSGSRGCSLDSSPKKNWVERGGGLPNYICKVAKGIMRSGKPKSQAIAIAVSRIKKWAAGGDDVDADTRAKAATAAAQWEALRARNKAKKVNLTHREHDGAEYLLFSNMPSYSTDQVRRAWDQREREWREAEFAKYGDKSNMPSEAVPYSWVTEVWTTHIIVSTDTRDGQKYTKVPYTVNSDGEVSFEEPILIEQQWVEVDDDDLTENEKDLLADLLLSAPRSGHPAVDRILGLADTLKA